MTKLVMNRLILLRHGEAEHGSKSGRDFDRRLTAHGTREAAAMGDTLARLGMAPTAEDYAWASNVVTQAADGAAHAVDGTMVDMPVLLRARQIVRAHQRFSNGS